ncbi:hypothetical protein ABIB40_000063 [Pedobacter sp. UYP30]|uniref:hypothetical protein n=1 Tax=Pedobacter sp. UYP30 TaxID=1756400 RepID=UPI0033960C24
MICIITGDIIGSRKIKEPWLVSLKAALKYVSKKNSDWEIFRGDSFQLEIVAVEALWVAIYLKACIRINKAADVRMAMGLGTVKKTRGKITEANGDAFVHSGNAFDGLKLSKVNLAIQSDNENFDEEMNVTIRLALVAMDSWGTATAEVVKYAMENENLLQNELAVLSGRTQSSVSEALKRARFNELMDMDRLYRRKVAQIIKG